MSEIWKDIHFWENGIEWDYRGLYKVSNHGNVKSFHNGKENILKAGKNKYGYELIRLCKNGKLKIFLIHRLVAHMFVENDNPIEKIEVNHIDENKENNHAENLEWCTREYNMNFGTRNERMSEMMKGKNNPNLGSLIARFDLEGDLIDMKYHFEFVQMGFNSGNIYSCCKGRYKSTGGFIFKYLSDVSDDVINSYIIRTKQIPITN